ncbi:MAG: GGDEF domain-containing protein, partial [Acidimicrobiales bacterium]
EGNLMVTVVARDISERKELEGRLAHQATHDTLTGLANRGAAITHLEQVLVQAERASTDTALLFIDLDRFKLVNDSHGHRGGDALLTKVAERMRGLSSAHVMPARFGGDEFVIILTNAGTIEVAVRLGQQVISVIEQSYEMDNATHTISASVGISYVAAGRATALGMVRDADHAVYQAKERGGRCVQVFDDALREAVDTRARTEWIYGERSNETNWCSTTSRSWMPRRACCAAPRRSCAGNTRRADSSSPTRSFL